MVALLVSDTRSINLHIRDRFEKAEKDYERSAKNQNAVKVFFVPIIDDCFTAIKEAKRALAKIELYHSDPKKVEELRLRTQNIIITYSYILGQMKKYNILTDDEIASRATTDAKDVARDALKDKVKALNYKISDAEVDYKAAKASQDSEWLQKADNLLTGHVINRDVLLLRLAKLNGEFEQ